MSSIVKRYLGILYGSVETHDCDPLMTCPTCKGTCECQTCKGKGENYCDKCNGNGKCTDCHGHGKNECPKCGGNGKCEDCYGRGTESCGKCHGSGHCQKCHGQGRVKCGRCCGSGYYSNHRCDDCGGTGWRECSNCNGTGECKKCKGSGNITCSTCHGTGHCKKCNGRGTITCETCRGTGDCTKCHGRGKLTCKRCHGNGKCDRCEGSGKVTCKRCNGSGFYQTFQRYSSEVYNHQSNYYGNSTLADNCNEASGDVVYSGVIKQWSDAKTLDFDKTTEVAEIAKKIDIDQYSSFLSASDENKSLHNPENAGDYHYDSAIELQTIPYTKIQYSVEGKEYEMYVMGNNKVACYENVPEELRMFSIVNTTNKAKYEKTLNKRVKAMAKLAAYIFQCDGKSQKESRLLNCIIKEMNLSEKNAVKFQKELEKYNTSMPYEKLEKEIACLFLSKKTLVFAWQCMSVDKSISDKEEILFEKLCNSFGVNAEEKNQMKAIASRFAKIEDGNIIKNYADIPAGVKLSYSNQFYNIILCVIIIVGLLFYFICSNLNTTDNVQSTESNEFVTDSLEAQSITEIATTDEEKSAEIESIVDNKQYVYANDPDGWVNVRISNNSKSDILGKLYNDGEPAEYVGEKGNWYKVKFNGKIGYIYKTNSKLVTKKP